MNKDKNHPVDVDRSNKALDSIGQHLGSMQKAWVTLNNDEQRVVISARRGARKRIAIPM
jgi:hypothetical protein